MSEHSWVSWPKVAVLAVVGMVFVAVVVAPRWGGRQCSKFEERTVAITPGRGGRVAEPYKIFEQPVARYKACME